MSANQAWKATKRKSAFVMSTHARSIAGVMIFDDNAELALSSQEWNLSTLPYNGQKGGWDEATIIFGSTTEGSCSSWSSGEHGDHDHVSDLLFLSAPFC
jgi:hypothetical protein